MVVGVAGGGAFHGLVHVIGAAAKPALSVVISGSVGGGVGQSRTFVVGGSVGGGR